MMIIKTKNYRNGGALLKASLLGLTVLSSTLLVQAGDFEDVMQALTENKNLDFGKLLLFTNVRLMNLSAERIWVRPSPFYEKNDSCDKEATLEIGRKINKLENLEQFNGIQEQFKNHFSRNEALLQITVNEDENKAIDEIKNVMQATESLREIYENSSTDYHYITISLIAVYLQEMCEVLGMTIPEGIECYDNLSNLARKNENCTTILARFYTKAAQIRSAEGLNDLIDYFIQLNPPEQQKCSEEEIANFKAYLETACEIF